MTTNEDKYWLKAIAFTSHFCVTIQSVEWPM